MFAMSKLENYNGSVQLMAGITQKGGGNFALIEAAAVQTKEDGTRLNTELEEIRGIATTQSDWGQTDETKADYIKNKPTVLTSDDVIGLINENETKPTQPDWNQEDPDAIDYIKNKPTILAEHDISVLEGRVSALENQMNTQLGVINELIGGDE
jgi:hypothetical protein